MILGSELVSDIEKFCKKERIMVARFRKNAGIGLFNWKRWKEDKLLPTDEDVKAVKKQMRRYERLSKKRKYTRREKAPFSREGAERDLMVIVGVVANSNIPHPEKKLIIRTLLLLDLHNEISSQ